MAWGCSGIDVQPSDIRLANRLAHEVLGRTLDEMPPQTRKLLVLIQEMVREMAVNGHSLASEVRFTRRDIRDWTNWSDNQLKVHCMRLTEMEYLLLHGGSRGHLLRYELLWDGGSGEENHLCGYPPGKATPWASPAHTRQALRRSRQAVTFSAPR